MKTKIIGAGLRAQQGRTRRLLRLGPWCCERCSERACARKGERGGGQLLWAVCGWRVLLLWLGRCAGPCRGSATLQPCSGAGACKRSEQLGLHVFSRPRCCTGQSRGHPMVPPRRRAGGQTRSVQFGAIGRVALMPPTMPSSTYRRARVAAAARSPAQIK